MGKKNLQNLNQIGLTLYRMKGNKLPVTFFWKAK
jgi:hypothetical protein